MYEVQRTKCNARSTLQKMQLQRSSFEERRTQGYLITLLATIISINK